MPGGVAGAQPCAAPYADQPIRRSGVNGRWVVYCTSDTVEDVESRVVNTAVWRLTEG